MIDNGTEKLKLHTPILNQFLDELFFSGGQFLPMDALNVRYPQLPALAATLHIHNSNHTHPHYQACSIHGS